jgi:hypothetical protein
MRQKCNLKSKRTYVQATVYKLNKFPFLPLQPIVGPQFLLERWEILITVRGDTKIVNCL